MSDPVAAFGRLVLVPNTLDLGEAPVDIRDVLPDGVLRRAAGLRQWIVEDARSTRAFLKRVAAVHPLAVPLQAIRIDEIVRSPKGQAAHAVQAGQARAQAVMRGWLQCTQGPDGHDVGLLSEAGLPGVADPGAQVVALAHAMGIEVVALPGASSIALAVAASGMNGQRFAFLGYVSQDADARRDQLVAAEARSAAEGQAQVLIETPYRNDALLDALVRTLRPDTRLALSRGLTLPDARQRSDRIDQWRARPDASPWNGAPAVFVFEAHRAHRAPGAPDGRSGSTGTPRDGAGGTPGSRADRTDRTTRAPRSVGFAPSPRRRG